MSYVEEYRALHQSKPDFGASSCQYLSEICLIIDYLKPKKVLDYGCGKAVLVKELARLYPDIEFYGYDPAIPERDTLPIEKADLIINTDVLEHIPEDTLPQVIEEISSISENAFFVLHHALAYNVLPNGENAHCTVKPPQWYYELLKKYFKTPYPLRSRGAHVSQSCIITFAPTVEFLKDYQRIIASARTKFLPHKLGNLIGLIFPKGKIRERFCLRFVKNKKY